MCNAFNHPPDCSCGWGGIWYGGTNNDGSDGWLFKNQPHPRKLGRQRGTHENSWTSLTIPNSKCPVCGESVYFYRSPYGGRVFFDDLGPPWPKHACTSGENDFSSPIKTPPWYETNWKYLSFVSIEKYNDTFLMSGSSHGKVFHFYFSAPAIVMAEIVRFRVIQAGKIELSILDYHATKNEWSVWSGTAYSSESKAIQNKNELTEFVIHRHFASEKEYTEYVKKIEGLNQYLDANLPIRI